MDTDEEKLNEVTQKIIGCAYDVHNTLGAGFAERVYENALVYELTQLGLAVQQQVPLVLVENKAVRNFEDGHLAQCINDLACTALPVRPLLNFGKKVQVKRFRGVGSSQGI